MNGRHFAVPELKREQVERRSKEGDGELADGVEE